MEKLNSRLPPLEPLVAFEAAARLLSFTRAAEELNLSQAAVSQRIRNLEAYLGTPLFFRSHKSVQLSPAGSELQHTVSATLRQLASAVSDIKTPATRKRLTVAADQSVAAMWLMPRLPDYQRMHPGTSIRLIASDNERDCLADDIQIAIIHGDGNWPGFKCVRLFEEEIFAVCSPAYVKENNVPRGAAFVDAAKLTELELLELEDNRWDWMNWRAWLSASGTDLSPNHTGYRINSYPLLIDAAKNGQGVALGWRYLIDDEMHSGALVKLLEHSVCTRFGYYLVWSANKPLSPSVAEFRQWCIDQLQ